VPLEKTRRVSRTSPCPTCGKPTWCLVARDGRYAVCMRVESGRLAHGGGWVHRLGDGLHFAVAAPDWSPASRPNAVASLARRHQAYIRLQAATVLDTAHRNALLARGYADQEIAARGYRTLPATERWRLAGLCRDGEADGLVGVPGFFQAAGHGGAYWSLAGIPGLLIPCRAPSGQMRAYRIRPDQVGKDEGKYRWLSSGKKPSGVSSGVHAHVARPLGDAWRDPTVWITEGEIKADLASQRLGAAVVSMPGVSCWQAVLRDVVELLPQGGQVVVALDADWRIKKAVHAAVWDVCLACQALGYEVRIAQWEPTHKGLDDLLTVGLHPTLTAVEDMPAATWPMKLSSRRLAAAPRTPATVPLTLAVMRARLQETMAAAFPTTTPYV
jgi:Domain of unknown function (DUF3854)